MIYTKTILESYDTLKLFRLFESITDKYLRATYSAECRIPVKTTEKNKSDLEAVKEVLIVRLQNERDARKEANKENWMTPYRARKEKEKVKLK